MAEWTDLALLYGKLVGGVGLGWGLGLGLPGAIAARLGFNLGKFLYWLGIPLSCLAFVRRAELTGDLWRGAIVAWGAVALALVLATVWMWGRDRDREDLDGDSLWRSRGSRGSFYLVAAFGNTGYLGFPVALAVVGDRFFSWSLIYDLLGTTLGAYGLGSALAAKLGGQSVSAGRVLAAGFLNPTVLGVGVGLASRPVALPAAIEEALQLAAWVVIALALGLIGLRLAGLPMGRSLLRALPALALKMLVVPLAIGLGLTVAGWTGPARLALVLQAAMPPAFATLVLSETYGLDRDLAAAGVAGGAIALLLLLPLWLTLFAP
jgi:predicted permease